MTLLSDLTSEVAHIFQDRWNVVDARVVPDPEDLQLSNDARHFERATILYADLSGSTSLVDTYPWTMSGEIYKTYLVCAARLIRSMDGEIIAYDGDRVMAIFTSDMQTTNAAKCGLQINWAVKNVINPALKKQYPQRDFEVKQVVGIDTSEIHAARIGIRGGNDLVWIGRAANYAAKLTECRKDYQTWLTEAAYKQIADSSKLGGTNSRNMWTKFTWTGMGDAPVYGSNWTWSFS